MRDILDMDQAVRDVILSRFVPGYRCGAAMPAGHQGIRVDLRDLEALSEYMISPRPPLPLRYAFLFFTRTPMAYWLGLFRALVPCIARGSARP